MLPEVIKVTTQNNLDSIRAVSRVKKGLIDNVPDSVYCFYVLVDVAPERMINTNEKKIQAVEKHRKNFRRANTQDWNIVGRDNSTCNLRSNVNDNAASSVVASVS